MPVNTKYIAAFEANEFFHIIAKAIGNNLLFKTDDNRHFFLKKYLQYSNGYLETYSYTLLDNHAHWLVKCCSYEDLNIHITSMPAEYLKAHQRKIS